MPHPDGFNRKDLAMNTTGVLYANSCAVRQKIAPKKPKKFAFNKRYNTKAANGRHEPGCSCIPAIPAYNVGIEMTDPPRIIEADFEV
jgi:hypothetical protein